MEPAKAELRGQECIPRVGALEYDDKTFADQQSSGCSIDWYSGSWSEQVAPSKPGSATVTCRERPVQQRAVRGVQVFEMVS